MFKFKSFLACASFVKTISLLSLLIGTGSALFLMTPHPVVAAESQKIVEDPTLEAVAKSIHPDAVCGEGVCFNMSQTCPVTLIFTRELKSGDSGIDVVSLQEFLISQKYMTKPKGVMLGTFGPITSTALLKYQKQNGLPATGIFDTASRNAFDSMAIFGDACFNHLRFDMLTFTMKSGINKKTIASNLADAGFLGPDKQSICYSATAKKTCLNIKDLTSFSALIPARAGVTKLATYFKSLKNVFTDVAYVQTNISEIQLLEPNYQIVTTATTSTDTIRVRATTTPVYDPYNPGAYTGPKSYTYTVVSSGNNPLTDADTYRSILEAKIPALDNFLYGNWRMTYIDSQAQSTNIGEDITMMLSESTKTVTVIGCNTYNAKLTVSYNVLQSDLATLSYKACDYSPRTIREGDFISVLRSGVEYQLKDDNTLLIKTSNAKVYQFIRL